MLSAPPKPLFRADQVGSLLRPTELKKLRNEHAAGKISAAELRIAEDVAIRRVVAQQEEVGLESITDGEFRREDFYTDFFVRGLGGVEVRQETAVAYFVDHEGRKIPVPWMATLRNEKFQAMMKARGDDPEHALTELYPDMINRAFANRPASLHLAMHLCRGNNQSGWFGEGRYDPVAEVLFNKINVDSYFLEYETARAGNFEPLRFVPKDKPVLLGLVSSKLPQLESKDTLKRRIDEAAKYIDIDRLALSPQCGFASSTEGNRLSEEEQFAKLRLVVEVADEVWGEHTDSSVGHSESLSSRASSPN